MVLDPADHDTWSCGSFFTNPILAAADMDALADRVRDRLGEGAPDLPVWPEPDGRRKTSAAWLIERAGFAKGFGSLVRRRCRTSTPWPSRTGTGPAPTS